MWVVDYDILKDIVKYNFVGYVCRKFIQHKKKIIFTVYITVYTAINLQSYYHQAIFYLELSEIGIRKHYASLREANFFKTCIC